MKAMAAALHRMTAQALAAADCDLDAGLALRAWTSAVAGAAGLGLTRSPVAALTLGTAVLLTPVATLFRLRHRRNARLVGALPDALDRLAADLRGGATVGASLRALGSGTGPLARDLAVVAHRVASDGDVAGALAWWRGARPVPAVALVAGALEVAHTVGGRTAGALEGMATGLRQQEEVVEEAAALSAQARLSALVVAAAPAGSLLFSLSVDPRVAAALFGTGPGRACLAAGLALEAGAALWMRRILRPVGP